MVDDEPSIRFLCRVNLELEGFRVLEASSLDEARSALANGAPALVLLDLQVGGESGWELLDEIRSEHAGLPVVLLTGSASVDGADRARADAVLPKPFSLDQLVSTVHGFASI